MGRSFNIVDQQAWFKHLYDKSSSSLVNPKTPLTSILMKNKNVDWVGDYFVSPARTGSAMGLGYRSRGQNLPAPIAARRIQPQFLAKRAYGTAEYDREAIVASRSSQGAFAKATVAETEAVVEGFMLHNLERVLFGDGTGSLGQIDDASITGAGTAASPWAFDLDVAPASNAYPKGNAKYLPQDAKIDLYTTAGVYGMTIQIVSATTSAAGVVSVTAITDQTGAAVTPVDNDVLYWHGNKDIEMVGLKSIAPISAGTLYGISQTDNSKYRGLLKSISGSLQYDDVNDAIEELGEENEYPNLGICSHKAYSLLKNLSEDHKRYETSVKSSDAKIGFRGIEAVSGDGVFPIVPSQMCPKDEIWLVNTKHLQLVLRENYGWFDNGGEILYQDPNKDVYSARYGGYSELFCDAPNTVMRIYGFTI